MFKKLFLFLALCLPTWAVTPVLIDHGGVTLSGSVALTGTDAQLFLVNLTGFGGTTLVSDDQGNTYTLKPDSGGCASTCTSRNGNNLQLWAYVVNPMTAGTVTFTLVANGTVGSIEVQVWKLTNTFDQNTSGTYAGTGPNWQWGPITPSCSDAVVASAVTITNAAAGPTGIDSGFTITDSNSSGAVIGGALAYKIQSGAASAEDPTWSFAGGNSNAGSNISFCYVATTSPLVKHKIISQ